MSGALNVEPLTSIYLLTKPKILLTPKLNKSKIFKGRPLISDAQGKGHLRHSNYHHNMYKSANSNHLNFQNNLHHPIFIPCTKDHLWVEQIKVSQRGAFDLEGSGGKINTIDPMDHDVYLQPKGWTNITLGYTISIDEPSLCRSDGAFNQARFNKNLFFF